MVKDLIIVLIIGYLVYKLFSGFILPLLNITSAANTHMRKMQEQMNAQKQEMDRMMNAQAQTQKKKVSREGDYIDYEEVR